MLYQIVDILVVEVSVDELHVLRAFAFHLALEKLFEEVEIFDDRLDLIAVESERLFQLVEDSDKVDDKSMRFDQLLLFVLIGAVDPRDGLKRVWSRMGLSRYMA